MTDQPQPMRAEQARMMTDLTGIRLTVETMELTPDQRGQLAGRLADVTTDFVGEDQYRIADADEPALSPTPARLTLLQAVADRRIIRGLGGGSYHDRTRAVVTARATELHRAGWIAPTYQDRATGAIRWQITDLGRQILYRYARPL